jgi:hypothetical protein
MPRVDTVMSTGTRLPGRFGTVVWASQTLHGRPSASVSVGMQFSRDESQVFHISSMMARQVD